MKIYEPVNSFGTDMDIEIHDQHKMLIKNSC